MVDHFWQHQHKIAEKILKADIKHYEQIGMGGVAMKKKLHLQKLMRTMQLSKEKVIQQDKKDELDAKI